jgi:hypothetical protein
MRYDYKVVPAPERGEKAKGVKGPEGRFAAAIERIMNDMAARGWEYQRTDTLPSEERVGLTQTVTVWRNLLIFRRPGLAEEPALAPRLLEAPLVLEQPVVAGRKVEAPGAGARLARKARAALRLTSAQRVPPETDDAFAGLPGDANPVSAARSLLEPRPAKAAAPDPAPREVAPEPAHDAPAPRSTDPEADPEAKPIAAPMAEIDVALDAPHGMDPGLDQPRGKVADETDEQDPEERLWPEKKPVAADAAGIPVDPAQQMAAAVAPPLPDTDRDDAALLRAAVQAAAPAASADGRSEPQAKGKEAPEAQAPAAQEAAAQETAELADATPDGDILAAVQSALPRQAAPGPAPVAPLRLATETRVDLGSDSPLQLPPEARSDAGTRPAPLRLAPEARKAPRRAVTVGETRILPPRRQAESTLVRETEVLDSDLDETIPLQRLPGALTARAARVKAGSGRN